MLAGILTLTLAISLTLVTLIFSFLNTGYQNISATLQQSQERILVDLNDPVPIKALDDLEKKWTLNPSLRWTYLVFSEDYVETDQSSGSYSVFGVNKDIELARPFPFDQTNANYAVLSQSAAEELFEGMQEKDIIGQKIRIAKRVFVVTAVDQSSLVENVYIPIENFLELYGSKNNISIGNFIFAENGFSAAQSEVLSTLDAYRPVVSKQSSAEADLAQFYALLVAAMIITVGLMIYVVLNFIYIFSFKINKDKTKWDILINLGATKKVLKKTIYIESGIMILAASIISVVSIFLISSYVNIEGFRFEMNLYVFFILMIAIAGVIIITVEKTLKKIWKSFFKGVEA